MSVVDDLRKVIQDVVAPDLKSLHVELKKVDEASRMRDDALSAKIDSKFDLLSAKIGSNHAAILNALNIEKRMDAVERKTNATM